MTLAELAVCYRSEAEAISLRIRAVEELPTHGPRELAQKTARLRLLAAMLRDDRAMANICEHYYDRDYHRSHRYMI